MKAFSKKLPYEVLLNELILVDSQDRFISSFDKWQAHSNHYLALENSLPHRAFSIFLFNEHNQLLMQKRSSDKKTFPLCWTNTCCSHPNMVLSDVGEKGEEPIRASLNRALERELRMSLDQDSFYFMNKIMYKQPGLTGNDSFGEFEVDYVYLYKTNSASLHYEAVSDEIAELKWITKEELPPFMEETINKGGYFSPWFSKMQSSGLLNNWWKRIESNTLKNEPGEHDHKVLHLI